MATEYGKRLKAAMEYAELSQNGLVEKTGLPQSTISSAINRGNGSAHTAAFAKACNVDANWLSTGEGRMEIESKQASTTRPLAPQDLSMALFNGYSSLVRVLHRNGSLDIADLVTDIGNTLDFRRSRGIESAEQNQMLELLYKSLLDIEKHESDLNNLKADFDKKSQSLRKPPGTDGSK